MRKCRMCGVPVIFVPGENGKIIPLDRAAPVYDVRKDLTGAEVAMRCPDGVYVNHFFTCTHPSAFNKRPKR